MVREFLRMSHIATGERLKDINLTIFEGESVFLLSNHRGELEEIWKVIAGYKKTASGTIFLEEKKTNNYNEEFCSSHGIFHIDTGTQLAESMTVAENIFVIQQRKGRRVFLPFKKREVELKTREVLQKVGLFCEPDTKVWQLDPFKRFQVCLAKAIVMGVRLLLIDEAENEFNSSEKRKLRELILMLRMEGVATLILADRPGELLEGTRKIVLIRNGRDIKIYFSQDKGYFSQKTLYETVTRAWSTISDKKGESSYFEDHVSGEPGFVFKGDGFEVCLSRGKTYGFYDALWDKEWRFLEHLTALEKRNHALYMQEGRKEGKTISDLIETGAAVYIPRDSAFLLLENMGIGKNIAIPNQNRAGHLGISVNRIDSFMEEEFCRKNEIPMGTPVWKLNCMQKKILSIHRWLLKRPVMLILEEPTYRLNMQEAGGVREYLRELAGQGYILLISESSFYEEELLCDMIIHTERNQYQKSIDRKDYAKIKAEWMF